MDTLFLPIRFTVFREDDGSMPLDRSGIPRSMVVQADADIAISNLNEVYDSIKIQFVQDGPINYIDDGRGLDGVVPISIFSFTSSNANFFIFPLSSGAAGRFNFLSFSFSPDNPYGPRGNGTVYISNTGAFVGKTLIHEMGHVLGLRHIFEGAFLYDNPADPIENSPMIFADRDWRELVIRENQPIGSVPFDRHNHETAGDRISDTPAWGLLSSNFPNPDDPDCFVYVDSIRGVENCSVGFTTQDNSYTGNYVDYNGHEIAGVEVGLSNLMSYNGSYRNNFTEEQYIFQSVKARRDAAKLWDISKGTQFVDTVQFWNTSVPIRSANIRLSHDDSSMVEGRYSHVTTPLDGSFSAKLFDSSVSAKSTLFGSGVRNREYVQDSDTSYAIYNYTKDDWLDDVTTNDIILLTRYILGRESLNSFQKLAADVSRDGHLSIFDIVAIRRVILGFDDEFKDYPSGPWQFVPEVVSQSSGFSVDPFKMTINGNTYYNEAPYIRSDFFFSPVLEGKAGFDAYKLGDVNGSSVERLTGGNISFEDCSEKETGEVVSVYASTFFGKNESLKYQIHPTVAKNIAGFQMEIEFDNTKLELMNRQVTAGTDLVERAAIETGVMTSGTNQQVMRWSNKIEKGLRTQVRLSYVFDGSNANSSQKIEPGEDMVELVFKTKEAGVDFSTAITMGTNIPFEVYEASGCVVREDFVSGVIQAVEGKSSSGSKVLSAYDKFNVSVSPNPVSDRATLIIKSLVDEKYEVTFYSMTTGEKIRSFTVATSGGYFYKNINTGDLPKDVFVVKIKGSQTNFSTKLVKL